MNLKAIRGMYDILPDTSCYWQLIEQSCRELALQYNYQEIRFPILEQTQLFKRTIGEVTDIVEKEMYTFDDRNGDSVTLRPEGTAGCVRAAIEHSLLHQRTQRLWYLGPMFRYERPQKGRCRQFHQFGLEAFGMSEPDIDVEQLLFVRRLWEKLGLADNVKLQVNSLGTSDSRAIYRSALVEYLQLHQQDLDEDSQRRLQTNPLRILDSKNPDMQELITAAPKLLDYIDDESRAHFERLLQLLDHLHVPYEINPRLVRGLDYYDFTVYEWVTDMLGAQGTVCAGGRYNTLVEQLGGKQVPAVGFALGLERTVLLLEKIKQCQQQPDIFMVLFGDAAVAQGLQWAEQLRSVLPQLSVEVNLTGGSFKSQFKRADKSGAQWALILGEDEVQNNVVSVKNLREDKPQQQYNFDELIYLLQQPQQQPA